MLCIQLVKRRQCVVEEAPTLWICIDISDLLGQGLCLQGFDAEALKGGLEDRGQPIPPLLGRLDLRLRLVRIVPRKAGLQIRSKLVSRRVDRGHLSMEQL
jgi:hypothetical protein